MSKVTSVVATLAMAAAAMPAAARPGDGPGSIVSATPIRGAPEGATAYKVRYRSTGANGRPATISGLVIVPRGPAPAGGRDIVAWAHGTTGIAEACAPSDASYRFTQIAGLQGLLAAGYVVAATDYQGLGNPGPHPYLAGAPSAHAVLDSVRAAHAMPKAHVGTRFAVWGESQGGHAALWAGKLAKHYAPDLQLAGIAAAVPPTDLKANLTGGTNAGVRAFLTAFTAESWSQVYHAPLNTVVKPHTAKLMGAIAKNCVTLDGFKLRTKIGLMRLIGQMRGVDLAASPRWSALMEKNSLTAAGLTMPLLIVQGSKDQIVAPAVTRKFYENLCRAGRPVTYVADDGDHITAGKRGAPIALSWIADRFAGTPAPSDCR